SALGVTPAELEAALFADLPGERLVAGLPVPLSPAELALRANLGLTQGLLCRATGVTLEIDGNARVLVRHAKLRGLLCTVSRPARAPAPEARSLPRSPRRQPDPLPRRRSCLRRRSPSGGRHRHPIPPSRGCRGSPARPEMTGRGPRPASDGNSNPQRATRSSR